MAAAGTATDPVSFLLSYGPWGAIIVLAFLGWIWFKPSVDQMIRMYDIQVAQLSADKLKAEEQRDKLLESQKTQMTAAITASTDALKRMSELVDDLLDRLDPNEPLPPSPPRRRSSSRTQPNRG